MRTNSDNERNINNSPFSFLFFSLDFYLFTSSFTFQTLSHTRTAYSLLCRITPIPMLIHQALTTPALLVSRRISIKPMSVFFPPALRRQSNHRHPFPWRTPLSKHRHTSDRPSICIMANSAMNMEEQERGQMIAKGKLWRTKEIQRHRSPKNKSRRQIPISCTEFIHVPKDWCLSFSH